jgi:TRAP-type transport system periplasmic protein
MLTTKNTPAKKPEDVKGLRIRVPEVPVFRDMVASWGATPTPIPMADIFTSLQAGMVDGQENPYPQILSNRFYEVQKYLIQTAHIVQTGSIIFSETLYQAQPKEFQVILKETAQDAQDWYLQFLTNDEAKMLDQLKGFGMVVVEPDVKAFREATTKIYDKYDSIWTKALREKIQNYKI